MSLFTRWEIVKCPKCGRVHCHATAGSRIRWRCKNCKVYRVATI